MPRADLAPLAVRLSSLRTRWNATAEPEAAKALGKLRRGGRVDLCTAGDFGLTELLTAILAQTGPAAVVAWTWSVHHDDGQVLGAHLRAGRITALTLLCDRSFPARVRSNPTGEAWLTALGAAVGEANIALVSNHAKVVLVRGDGWHLVLTSSMNFNRNYRAEAATLTDCPTLWRHWTRLTARMLGGAPRGLGTPPGKQADREHVARALGADVAPAKPAATKRWGAKPCRKWARPKAPA